LRWCGRSRASGRAGKLPPWGRGPPPPRGLPGRGATGKARGEGGAPPSGLLLLDKPPGITSFEALFPVKRALGSGKAGHTGTLDKFAGGLLLVLTGRALKLSPWFTRCAKEYEGTLRFGTETDTLDPEGSVAAEAPPPSREALEAALPRFTGEILQAPPAYSAIRLGGKRAHELARAGKAPEMKSRPVTVYLLELRSWEPPLAGIYARCSGGTYLRSLARDLARAAGSRAHRAALRRTGAAGFRVEDAAALESLEGRPGALEGLLRPVDRGLIEALGLPRFDLDPGALGSVIQGKNLSRILGGAEPSGPASGGAAALFCGDVFAGIAELKAREGGEGFWTYGCVYARGEDPGKG
jgi:tRNA pseudouridine55 synthase